MEKSRNSCILEVEEDLLDRPNGLPPPLLPPLMVPFCCCCSFLAFLSSLKNRSKLSNLDSIDEMKRSSFSTNKSSAV